MPRPGKDGVGRAFLHHAAEIHHDDPVADVPDHVEIVGDEQHGEPEVALQPGEQIDDLRLDRDVERRDRLVRDDEARLHRERAGDDDPLALAAGELMRIAVRMGRGEADALEQLHDARPPPARLPEPMDLERLAENIRDAHARVEAGERILENDLHPPPQRA